MSNLLLVDDNAQLLDFYKLVLENAGHHVRTAENCAEAVALLGASDPEIIIMDLRMPALEDGLGLIRTLKQHTSPPGKRPMKVVVISGWVEDLLNAPEKGSVDRVLAKPVRMDLLLRSISELALLAFLFLVPAPPPMTYNMNTISRAPYNEVNAQGERA